MLPGRCEEPWQIPMWNQKQSRKVECDMSFLPIHELLEAVIPQGEEDKWCAFGPDQQGFRLTLEDWGAKMGVGHYAMRSFVAIGSWGDSAVFTKRDSVNLLVFAVLGGGCRRRFWVCGINKRRVCQCGCQGRCTFDAILRVIAWMFRALLAKRYPDVGPLGERWAANDWRAAMAGKRLRFGGACIAKCGDWSWFKSVLGMRGWRGDKTTGRMCWMCQASFHDDHSCFDFSANARWRTTMTSMSDFWVPASCREQFVSAIWEIPGVHLSYVRPDLMHISCLGILQYLSGNCLWVSWAVGSGMIQR